MEVKGYAKQTLYRDTFNKLQKELHYTRRQMFKEFPDLGKKVVREESENMIREHNVFFAKIMKGVIE